MVENDQEMVSVEVDGVGSVSPLQNVNVHQQCWGVTRRWKWGDGVVSMFHCSDCIT